MTRPFAIRWGNTTVSFSHYPWSAIDEGGPMPDKHLRVHGHIHNNGYTRSAYVPFLRQHVNLSVEQTKYRPVHLGTLLSAVLDGAYAADDGAPTSIDAEAVEAESAHVSRSTRSSFRLPAESCGSATTSSRARREDRLRRRARLLRTTASSAARSSP